MFEETLILCGDERVHDMRRQVLPGDEDAPALPDLRNQTAVAAVDPERNLQRNVADRLGGGQSGLHVVPGANEPGNDAEPSKAAEREKHD